MSRITSGIHRTGGQFYDLYPAYVGPGLASWAASFVLVSGLWWWKTAPNNRSAPCRGTRRPLMRARRCESKPRAGRHTVRGGSARRLPKNAYAHCPSFWAIVGRICEFGVHFRKEAWNFALGGFWVCRFQKSRETRRHSNGSRLKLEVKDGRHQNTFLTINRLKDIRLRWSWCLFLCFWGQGIQ